VGALLLLDLLAANIKVHQALHNRGSANSSTCVLCLFAKGNIELPEGLLKVFSSIPCWSSWVPHSQAVALACPAYLVSSCRAPPRLDFPRMMA
jgi:hypothetical protein